MQYFHHKLYILVNFQNYVIFFHFGQTFVQMSQSQPPLYTNLDLLRQENQSQRPSSSLKDEYSDINSPDVRTNEYDYAEEEQTSFGNSLAPKAVNHHWSRDHPGYICSIWPS